MKFMESKLLKFEFQVITKQSKEPIIKEQFVKESFVKRLIVDWVKVATVIMAQLIIIVQEQLAIELVFVKKLVELAG